MRRSRSWRSFTAQGISRNGGSPRPARLANTTMQPTIGAHWLRSTKGNARAACPSSGFNVDVSDADGVLEKQARDAVRFLKSHAMGCVLPASVLDFSRQESELHFLQTNRRSSQGSATGFFQERTSRGRRGQFSLAHHERRSVAANHDSSTASNLGGCEIAPRNGGGAESDSRRDQRRRVGTCR